MMSLPAYANITDGTTADNKGAYDTSLLKRSLIVADRFYNDFSLLNVWDSSEIFLVIRHKNNIQYRSIKEKELPDNRHEHILIDEIIELPAQNLLRIIPKGLGE